MTTSPHCKATTLWPGAGQVAQPQNRPRWLWPTPPALPSLGG